MVLIGLIIIAAVLMALLVPGIRWKPPVRNASGRAGPGNARIPGR
jgi:hypothetical protein